MGLQNEIRNSAEYLDKNKSSTHSDLEVQQLGKMVSFKSDVYIGIVLLEMLTGKSHNQVAGVGEEGVDLPRWVLLVAAEKFEAEEFDTELLGTATGTVLQVAMKCVEVVVEQRPEMWEVVRMLEMVDSGEFRSRVRWQGWGSGHKVTIEKP